MIALIVGEARRFIDLDESLEASIKQLVRAIITRQYQRLGWKEKVGESASDEKLRATIIGLGAYADEPDIIKKSLALFKLYQKSADAVPSELRSIVFSVPVKKQVPGALTYLLELHDSTANSDLKSDICAAACATHSDTEAALLLKRLKDPKLVKPQDADRWLVQLIRNRYVKQVGWSWMVENWSWLEETYKQDNSYDMLPRYAAGACNTQHWAKTYKKFFEPKMDQVVLKRNIAMGLEEIDSRVTWLERDHAVVKKFLTTYIT